jgi:hypothetical protein
MSVQSVPCQACKKPVLPNDVAKEESYTYCSSACRLEWNHLRMCQWSDCREMYRMQLPESWKGIDAGMMQPTELYCSGMCRKQAEDLIRRVCIGCWDMYTLEVRDINRDINRSALDSTQTPTEWCTHECFLDYNKQRTCADPTCNAPPYTLAARMSDLDTTMRKCKAEHEPYCSRLCWVAHTTSREAAQASTKPCRARMCALPQKLFIPWSNHARDFCSDACRFEEPNTRTR